MSNLNEHHSPPVLALPLIIHSVFVRRLSSDKRSPQRPLLPLQPLPPTLLAGGTLGNIREYYTQELTLQITLPGLGLAYTPPCLGQDNPGSSGRYTALITQKVRRAADRRGGGEGEREGRPWKAGRGTESLIYVHSCLCSIVNLITNLTFTVAGDQYKGWRSGRIIILQWSLMADQVEFFIEFGPQQSDTVRKKCITLLAQARTLFCA